MKGKISGIYKIEHKITGQKYIGQSKDIETRFKRHCSVPPIDMAIAQEGVDSFDFSIIEEVPEDELLKKESYWIDYYMADTNPKHYNVDKGDDPFNRRKYTLWDTSCCNYRCNHGKDENKSYKNFIFRYKGYILPIPGFNDFLSCEIISDLVDKFINN